MRQLYLILVATLIFSCNLSTEPEIVFLDKIIYIDKDIPLLFTNTNQEVGLLSQGSGVLFTAIVYNPTDSTWYGYPEILLYGSDHPISADSTFEEDGLYESGKGIFTTHIDNSVPRDTLNFIPSNSYRSAIAFVGIDHEKVKSYNYALWRVVSN